LDLFQEVWPGVAVATVTGHLVVKDNKYSLALLEVLALNTVLALQ
jgi:hypothetical protein